MPQWLRKADNKDTLNNAQMRFLPVTNYKDEVAAMANSYAGITANFKTQDLALDLLKYITNSNNLTEYGFSVNNNVNNEYNKAINEKYKKMPDAPLMCQSDIEKEQQAIEVGFISSNAGNQILLSMLPYLEGGSDFEACLENAKQEMKYILS